MTPETETAIKERRFETLALSLASMPQFLAGNLRVVNGLPEDAYVFRVYADFPSDTLHFVFAHPSFKPVAPNSHPRLSNALFVKSK